MRSSTRRLLSAALAAAALALAGCGNYSTEDLRFLAALPQRQDLAFRVPATGQPGALTSCPTRTSSVWLEAKPTSDKINAGVDFLLALVDVVRSREPSWRKADERGWGPFPSKEHPGREVMVVIARTYPPELGGGARYGYGFLARLQGTPDWAPLIGGAFDGGSASHGKGEVVLDFDKMIALGMNDPGGPTGQMAIGYDRASDPVTIQLVLASDGFGAVGTGSTFAYRSASYAAGGGVFDFAFRDGQGNLFYVTTGYDAAGAGRDSVVYQGASGASAAFRECWGAGACLVYVQDPGNYSCSAADWPCDLGAATDCPLVPASPF